MQEGLTSLCLSPGDIMVSPPKIKAFVQLKEKQSDNLLNFDLNRIINL